MGDYANEPLSEEEVNDLTELGEQVGATICAVLDYVKYNSTNHEATVQRLMGDLFVKVGVIASG